VSELKKLERESFFCVDPVQM